MQFVILTGTVLAVTVTELNLWNLLINISAQVIKHLIIAEAFVVCLEYSPPEGYIPNMSNPLLDHHYGKHHPLLAACCCWTCILLNFI